MFHLLWFIAAIPFASAAALALFGSRLSRRIVAILGAGSIGLAAALTVLIAAEFILSPPPANAYVQHLWTWMSSGGFQPEIALYLDPGLKSDRKSTRLNSSHSQISYAVFCLKKKTHYYPFCL